MNQITCTCCGTPLTAPQFHDGKPYGYTCIRKIVPGAKKSSVLYLPLPYENARVADDYAVVDITFNGNTFTVPAFYLEMYGHVLGPNTVAARISERKNGTVSILNFESLTRAIISHAGLEGVETLADVRKGLIKYVSDECKG